MKGTSDFDMSTLPRRLRHVAAEVDRLNLIIAMSDALSDDLKVDVLTRARQTSQRLTMGPLKATEEA